jgi:putative membrane protein
MSRFLIRLVISAIAFGVITSGFLAGLRITATTQQNQIILLVVLALVFGLVNAIVKPLVQFLTCPLVLLTLGLFNLIISGAMLLLTAYISSLLQPNLGGRLLVDNLLWGIVGVIGITAISFVLERLLGVHDEAEYQERRHRRERDRF